MNANTLYEKLTQLDYSEVDAKVDKEAIRGHSIQSVRAETLKFLALCATDSEANAPSKIVDEYWHAAILNTQKYEEMCKVMGRTIHHNQDKPKYAPYFDGTMQKIKSTYGSINQKIWTSYGNCGYGGCGSTK